MAEGKKQGKVNICLSAATMKWRRLPEENVKEVVALHKPFILIASKGLLYAVFL